MLKPVRRGTLKAVRPGSARFVLVASKYNDIYVDGMLRAARAVLQEAGIKELQVLRVPGAFEIPVVAARVASDGPGKVGAVICLGVILRGQTTHAQFIGESVSAALAQIQVRYLVPIIHEVLLLENEDQAKARCLSGTHNRGEEAARTALEMAELMSKLGTPAAVRIP